MPPTISTQEAEHQQEGVLLVLEKSLLMPYQGLSHLQSTYFMHTCGDSFSVMRSSGARAYSPVPRVAVSQRLTQT